MSEPISQAKIHFHPDKNGLGLFLGELGGEIMEIIWEHGPMTVKRAQYHLNKIKPAAYTTVMTVMNRLNEKKVLHRTKIGHSFTYTPAMERNQFINYSIKEILGSIMAEFPEAANRSINKLRKKQSSVKSKKRPEKK